MAMRDAVPFSCIPGIAWPGVPTADGATMLALQYQLESSQRWPKERLRDQQFRQLRVLAAHAVANVPYYRGYLERVGVETVAALNPESFLRWPVLRKSEVAANPAFTAKRIPRGHGQMYEAFTTGSTGEPTRVIHSDVARLFARALVLRDHLWHGRDFRAKYAAIRGKLPKAVTPSWWSVETNVAFNTGPLATLSAMTDPEEQLTWLISERPAYVLTYPTNLRPMVELSMSSGRAPAGLRQVISFTQMLQPDLRSMIERAWQTEVVDVYSSEEFGPIALQCPEEKRFHIQEENLYVEILREDGSPCVPGEMGAVVVTALHNFPMPLVRYELGDYAVVGEQCPCGRGLTVLSRVAGRFRNLARDPSGRRFMPWIPFGGWLDIAPIRRVQLVQKSIDQMQLRYVMERALRVEEEARLTQLLKSHLGYAYDVTYTRVDQIERVRGEKFEDFISEIE